MKGLDMFLIGIIIFAITISVMNDKRKGKENMNERKLPIYIIGIISAIIVGIALFKGKKVMKKIMKTKKTITKKNKSPFETGKLPFSPSP
tara:strand:+ start:1048 stop:1317 length:270 start_codon:yes stop_codon:yes gene_type:complete